MLNLYLDMALVCLPILAFFSLQHPKMTRRDFRLQYFIFSFLSILAVRCVGSSYLSQPDELAATDVCQTLDQPNPIASSYPGNATGTLNGTIAILPIPLKLARQLIPPQYRILEQAYRALLPSFPADMYPAVIQALHDHEVQAFGYKIPDFSRTGIEFPFVDLLSDNSTSFKWAPSLLMTSTSSIALKGAADYGTVVYPSVFDPPCDAYRSVPSAKAPHTTLFSAKSPSASISTTFSPSTLSPYPMSFFKNITNQPIFADGKTCDNMIRLFNTSVSVAPNRIESVQGTVRVKMFPLESEEEWMGVYGLRMDTAFIENNYLPCESFRGYGA